MIRLCGASLGFLAFAVTVFLGIAAGNPVEVTLLRAIAALFVFCLMGLCTGWVADCVLDEHALARHREMCPDESDEEPAAVPDKQGSEPAAG